MHKTNVFWTDDELKILKENYCKPDGIKIIQTLLPHRGYNSIKGMANVNGLFRWKQHLKNRQFFDVPNDISNMISGFIAADGCISEARRALVITLSEKDETHLEMIREKLEYTGLLNKGISKNGKTVTRNGISYIIKPSRYVSLSVSDCPEWILALKTHWNITPRKTNTLQPPNITNLRHILCYLSGLIDGDGWVCLNAKADSKHGKVLEISVMGTKELMIWTKRIFDLITPGQTMADIKPTSSPNGAVYTIRGTRAYLLASIFLSLDIPRLERKWAAAREYMELLDETGGTTIKMNRWIQSSGFDNTLIDRLKTDEILVPAI